jgi:hypothetical protein
MPGPWSSLFCFQTICCSRIPGKSMELSVHVITGLGTSFYKLQICIWEAPQMLWLLHYVPSINNSNDSVGASLSWPLQYLVSEELYYHLFPFLLIPFLVATKIWNLEPTDTGVLLIHTSRKKKVKNFLPLWCCLFVSAALLFGNNLSNLEQSMDDHEILPNFKLVWKRNKHFENMEDFASVNTKERMHFIIYC